MIKDGMDATMKTSIHLMGVQTPSSAPSLLGGQDPGTGSKVARKGQNADGSGGSTWDSLLAR
jgi:hypothetical protein